jgi:hypothetical protein
MMGAERPGTTGVYRRRIRLIAAPGTVRAALEDTAHAMRLVLRHDGARVTGIEPRFTRIPLTTCAGAAEPLRALVGLPLASYPEKRLATLDPRLNCTHLYHLALLALAHASRNGTRQYDVAVPCDRSAPVWASLHRDGAIVHHWQIEGGGILAPAALAGRPVLQGFSRWAAAHFDAETFEAAIVLHNGIFVSGAGHWETTKPRSLRASDYPELLGACFSYQPVRVQDGVYIPDSPRDTTPPDVPLLVDFE